MTDIVTNFLTVDLYQRQKKNKIDFVNISDLISPHNGTFVESIFLFVMTTKRRGLE